MRKRLISYAVAVFMLISVVPVYADEDIGTIIAHFNEVVQGFVPEHTHGEEIVYSDIIECEWAHESIYALTEAGVLVGDQAGLFHPDASVTVKEFTKMLVLSLGLVDDRAASNYSDVPPYDWSYLYISSAKECGLLDMFAGDSLGADGVITREQMAYMAGKALEQFGVALDFTQTESFLDGGEIAPEAVNYVYALKNLGIIKGMGNNLFEPNRYTRRSEAAVIIYKVILAADKNLGQEG